MNTRFLELMQTGGPLMWVIFIVAFTAFSLIVWQTLVLLKNLRLSYEDYRWLQSDADIFMQPDGASRSPIRALIKNVEKCRFKSREEVAGTINVQLATIVPKLEGHLGTISTIASILPMLGLLGTVLGMINVFEVVAIHGSGKPEAMAEGISQALLTTASGLIFAIPIIFLHHLLMKKFDRLILLVTQSAQILLINCSREKSESSL